LIRGGSGFVLGPAGGVVGLSPSDYCWLAAADAAGESDEGLLGVVTLLLMSLLPR